MRNRGTILMLACSLYAVFNFMFFPALSITVNLASIPLVMLGGWCFGHRGAFFTTLATVPYHFFVLAYHSDFGSITYEALNPFGIGSQLIFGHSTALLKITRDRYQRLNNSLEELVAERTSELEQLTLYLMETESREYSNMLTTLLEIPLKQLESMKKTSLLLAEHLAAAGHQQAGQASSIAKVVESCIDDLQALESWSPVEDLKPAVLEDSIRILTGQLTEMSEVQVQFISDGRDHSIGKEKNHDLCHIVYEAVSNALQHANPSYINIGLETDSDATTLFIENNGKPLNDNITEGMGLPLMRYRASRIGASFTIKRTDEGRTRCACLVPRQKKND